MRTGFVVIGVTGSRFWWDAARLGRELDQLARGRAGVFLHHGMCPPRSPVTGKAVHWDRALAREARYGEQFWGADWLADRHAERRGWFILRHPADWNAYGKRAGMIRNGEMVQAARAHVWAGFPFPDSSGTLDCLRKAGEAGVPIRVFRGKPRSKTGFASGPALV